jgi:hypothetical protein
MFANFFFQLCNIINESHKIHVFFPNHYQVAGVSNLLKTDLEKGISGDDADLLRRRNAFGSNNYPRKKGRSFVVNKFDSSVQHFWGIGLHYIY